MILASTDVAIPPETQPHGLQAASGAGRNWSSMKEGKPHLPGDPMAALQCQGWLGG